MVRVRGSKSRRCRVDGVIWRAAASWTALPTPGDPLSLPTSAFEASAAIGVGAFGVAQHAVTGFRALEASEAAAALPKVFIVTGNITPFRPPSENVLAIQTQKKISAYLVELLANRHASDNYRYECLPHGGVRRYPC